MKITFAQRYSVSGFVTDHKSGEALVGATVFAPGTNIFAITNNFGFYSISMTEGHVQLVFSYVGFACDTIMVELTKNITLNKGLNPVLELQEVVVSHSRIEKQLHSPQMGMINLPMSMVNKLPALAGEADLLKVLQYYPGVSAGAEGSAGLYVRGGSPDQNLILLDGVPVYNISHLFGFVSVFNPDAVSNVQLYKGAFPARYGGRLSSVVDITMKEGNSREYITQGSIGPLSAKIAFEGPIWKEKTSFIFTGRRSLIGFLLQPISISSSKNAGDDDNYRSTNYYFYDANLKLNHRFSDRSRLYLGLYNGKDVLSTKSFQKDNNIQSNEENGLGWGNLSGSMRWNYVFGPKLFSNVTLTYTRFFFDVGSRENKSIFSKKENEDIRFRFYSGIEDKGVKFDLDYNPHPNHYVKMGAGFINHTFTPGIDTYNLKGDSLYHNEFGNKDIAGNEFVAYAEDEFNVGDRLRFNLGIHFSGFQTTTVFYPSLEPRISARYTATEFLSLKAAYARTSQYVHLVSKSSIGLPIDIWLPISDKLLPLKASQITAGIVTSLPYKLELSVEGYYKKMDNVLEYKEGSSFFKSSVLGWEEELERGKGWVYGAEVLLEKNTGSITGWIAYSLSYNQRQFDNLNFGKPFFYTYDRRHEFNIVLNKKFSEKSDIGMVWVFNTGRAHTLPTQLFLPVGSGIFDYYQDPMAERLEPYTSERNNYRAPSYHRLDISWNRHKKTRWGERTWSFGLYNAYSRLNAFQLKLKDEGYGTRLIKTTIFPIIPFVNYSFKF